MPSHHLIGLIVGLAVVASFLYVFFRSVRFVPNNRVAIVEKLWSRSGSISSGLIALKGEAGFQPELLRGGYHFFFPLQYRVHTQPLVTIPQGQIGYVFARDGKPLEQTQTLASNLKTRDFLDVRAFLEAGGQQGPQRAILREGTYPINLAQFIVITQDGVMGLQLEDADIKKFGEMQAKITERSGFVPVVIKDKDDMIGVVTVHDGPALGDGHIIAPRVGIDEHDLSTFHNSFQDPEKFLLAGGRLGRQLQVLVDGTYYLNRLFATVETLPKTTINIGFAGVVVSYVGEDGDDISGDDFHHGELVARGSRGVWAEPLTPSRYAWNPYAGKIVEVPTTNFMLTWDSTAVEQHKLDENLSEVTLITKDAFEPLLPLSVVLHINQKRAPEIIQRFGDIKRLVEQTLNPMVTAYFKNVAQTKTLIELLQHRSDVQDQAKKEMKERFAAFSLELEEVLIGTPRAQEGNDQIEKVLDQLRERQVAAEKVTTYKEQEKAAAAERELNGARAKASQQEGLTRSELSVTIAENEGQAAVKTAQQQATVTETNAKAAANRVRIEGEGEASKIKVLAEAEADRIERTGAATASAIEKQVAASGGAEFQLRRQIVERVSTALEKTGVDVVPRFYMGGGQGAGGNDSMSGILSLMLSGRIDGFDAPAAKAKPPADAEAAA